MGCGASSAASTDDSAKCREEEVDEQKLEEQHAERSELQQAGGAAGSDTPAKPTEDGRFNRTIESDREDECRGPNEMDIDLPEKQVTAATAGPAKKGIYVRPSSKCKAQVLFMCGGAEDAALEMKEYDSVDDVRREWSDTGEGIPGVYYARPVNKNCTVASLAPSRYMYRWSIAGERCVAPGRSFGICEGLHAFHSRSPALAEAALALAERLPAAARAASPYLRDGGGEKLAVDLAELATCRSARYLSNDLGHFKTALVEAEDRLIYNLFQFTLGVEAQVGYFTGSTFSEHVVSAKEAALSSAVRRAAHADNLAEQLESGKTGVKAAADAALAEIFAAIGLAPATVLPGLDAALRAAAAAVRVEARGVSDKLVGAAAAGTPDTTGCRLARDRNPIDIKKRVEEAFFAEYSSSSPAKPVLCAQGFYDVDLYIVFPEGTKNGFKRAYAAVWEDGTAMRPLRVSMKEKCNSDDEDNASDGDDDGGADDVSGGDSAEEGEDADPENPHWRGFYCTVPVRPDVVYCYRIVVDKRMYVTPTKSKQNRLRYCKKFRISPSVGPWSLNALQLAGIV
eukprot:gene6950-10689_t